MTPNRSEKLSEAELESDAATALGKLLFAFAHLEVDIGLFLTWSRDGEDLDRLRSKYERYSFHKKLSELGKVVTDRLGQDAQHAKLSGEYDNWHETADTIRTLRNAMAHDRWAFLRHSQQVVRVTGLPGSPSQKETRYTIAELAIKLNRVQKVAADFSKFRHKWTKAFKVG